MTKEAVKAELKSRREIVFGFVAPLGVDKDLIEDCLRTALCAADYQLHKVHVSAQLDAFTESNGVDYLRRKQALMDAGDRMRVEWNEHWKKVTKSGKDRGDAAALASVARIRKMREEKNVASEDLPSDPIESEKAKKAISNQPLHNVAFLVDSLKRPDELQLLRRIYGPAFVSVGIYAPPERRRDFCLRKQGADDSDADQLVQELMRRDETGEDSSQKRIPLGQRVSDAFFICDYILDANKEKREIVSQLTRLIELLFGDRYKTPSFEEVGMFVARGVQVRSGSLARQIGAAILRDDGSAVAIGTNEAARPISGGQYWYADDHEYSGRDIVYSEVDTSDEFRAEMLSDLLDKLDAAGALDKAFSTKVEGDANAAESDSKRKQRMERLYYNVDAPLRRARLRDNIDYVRAVHAEEAAITDAARHGVPTKKTTMFTTTFPCHECARNIVAAGIKEVVYLEPYPKSAVKRLYRDSIQVDPHKIDKKKVTFRTFVGVSPGRYLEFFTVDRDRKDEHGRPYPFNMRKQPPHLPEHTPSAFAAISTEGLEINEFAEFLNNRHQIQSVAQPSPS